MRIFYDLMDAMELAEEIGNKEVYELLKQTGDKIADILDKENESKNETG